MATKLTRREMIKLSTAFAVGAVLASCAPAPTKAPTPTSVPAATAAPTTQPTVQPAATEAKKVVGTELLKLVCSTYWLYSEPAANNANDIVTPYFEKMWNVKLELIGPPPERSLEEDYALHKAAGTIPDIWGPSGRLPAQKLVLYGDFADMTDYLPKMPTYTRYLHQETWPRYENNGRHYCLPKIGINGNAPEFKDNIYYKGFDVWPLLAREDILAKCGYKFISMGELKKETTDKGIWPTLDQLAIEPAIDTPEAFDELLRKIKALDIRVGAQPLYPINSIYWSVFHISSMMDNGHWRVNDEGEVDGYLGLPGAEPWYRLWSKWYQDGLLDPDYVIQKNDQLQAKWASGQAAIGLMVPNLPVARQALLSQDPTAYVRPIPWPKKDKRYGFFDVFEGGGWPTFVFNKNIKDMDRIVQMIEYCVSEDWQEIWAWGPPDAGLYVTGSDGKKYWKDEETRRNIMENVANTKNADYYGLYYSGSSIQNRVYWALPGFDAPWAADPRYNYPPQLQIELVIPRVYSTALNCGFNTDGRATYGDGGGNCEAVNAYFWSSFVNGDISKLLTAENDGAFKAAWDEIQGKLHDIGKYDAAKADVTKWFAEFGPAGLKEKVKV